MGLFEERHERRMRDPEYARAYTEADAELSAVSSLVVQLSWSEDDRFPNAFSIASPATVTSSTGAFQTSVPLWTSGPVVSGPNAAKFVAA